MKPCFVVYNSSNHLLCLCSSNRAKAWWVSSSFAPYGYLGPFSWSLRILFLDALLGMVLVLGLPRCCQLGNSVPLWTSPRDSLDFFRTGWEDSKNVPKDPGGAQNTPEPQNLIATALLGLGSLWLSLIHHPHLIGGEPVSVVTSSLKSNGRPSGLHGTQNNKIPKVSIRILAELRDLGGP